MKAMLLHHLESELELTEVDEPKYSSDELVVKVLTTSLNFADTLMVDGKYQEKPQLPFAIGMEICGLIVKMGSKVKDFNLSERVVCYVGFGGAAEYVTVKAKHCFSVPNTISNEIACCLTIAYGSTEIALNYKAQLKQGETLLVTGATSAVGISAIEIGKFMGARVIALCRGAFKCQLAKQKGADVVIDSEEKNFLNDLKSFGGAHVIYDPVGGEIFSTLLSIAKPEARILPVGFASGTVPKIPANIIMVKNLSIIGFYIGLYKSFRSEILNNSFQRLIGFCERGVIKPNVSHIFPLNQANEALAKIKERKAVGKIVLKVAD